MRTFLESDDILDGPHNFRQEWVCVCVFVCVEYVCGATLSLTTLPQTSGNDDHVDEWIDRWMDGWMDGWMDRWLDAWMDPLVPTLNKLSSAGRKEKKMGARGPECPLFITTSPLGNRRDNKRSVKTEERSQSPGDTEDLTAVERMPGGRWGAGINITNLQGFQTAPRDSLGAHLLPIVCLTRGARPGKAARPQRSANQYPCTVRAHMCICVRVCRWRGPSERFCKENCAKKVAIMQVMQPGLICISRLHQQCVINYIKRPI